VTDISGPPASGFGFRYKLEKSYLRVCNATFGRKLKFEGRFLFTNLKFIPSNHRRIRRWIGVARILFGVTVSV
jgi:hypothetical protein